jgi:glutamate--cysteine ligase
MDSANTALFKGILRGVEKENLRVTRDNTLALTPHPQMLGSALTHPHITTDFSEALVEFITSPSHRIDTLLNQLDHLHRFTHTHLDQERLWPHSMPCLLPPDSAIPLAHYGTTNRGLMKTVYREGLGQRYGRTMQTVAGLHFNFSLPTSFWAFLHHQQGSIDDLDTFTHKGYFNLIRNFRRYYWLLIYLFGASPALSQNFVAQRPHQLQRFESSQDTLYLPYATSLRMGDLGYQSQAQEQLYVCYNGLNSYVKTLGKAIATPYAPYEAIGLQSAQGKYLQLNTSLLQIENEFYSAIRPKRTAQKGETALTALCLRGVEYIEVRCLDLDPYSPLGITPSQIRFLDTLLVACALMPSPLCDATEFANIQYNQKMVVTQGRKPGAQLKDRSGSPVALKDWALNIMEDFKTIAELMDHCMGGWDYLESWQEQKAKIENPELTPSARILAELHNTGKEFIDWTSQLSSQHQAYFAQHSLTTTHFKRWQDMADESLALQKEEEIQPQIAFSDYLKAYYLQYKSCCGEMPSTICTGHTQPM